MLPKSTFTAHAVPNVEWCLEPYLLHHYNRRIEPCRVMPVSLLGMAVTVDTPETFRWNLEGFGITTSQSTMKVKIAGVFRQIVKLQVRKTFE